MNHNQHVYSKHLGQKSQYADTYNAKVLVAIPRSAGRKEIGLIDEQALLNKSELAARMASAGHPLRDPGAVRHIQQHHPVQSLEHRHRFTHLRIIVA